MPNENHYVFSLNPSPKQKPIFFTSTNTSFNFTTPDFQSVLLTCIELETVPSKLSISIKLAGY